MREKRVSALKNDENDIQIKLKPIMGIRPGVYLTILYSAALLIIMFFLLMFPGLKNPGAVLIVKTEPDGAAIRVNDVYMGLSGSKIFVPKGTHIIEAVMPGFESQSAVHAIPNRVFGSRFSPKKYEVEFKLITSDPIAAFALYAAEFASWSFAGEPTAAWQIPMSLSQGAYRVGSYLNGLEDSELRKDLENMLVASSRFTVTRAALRDLVRAKILLDNDGCAPSPVALLASFSDMLAFLSTNPGSSIWLADLLTADAASVIKESEWYKSESMTISRSLLPSLSSERPGARRINIAGTAFTSVPAGYMHMEGRNYLRSRFTSVEAFMVSDHITRASFETFLNQNPQWREHLTEYFSEELSFNPSSFSRDTVTGITLYAAQAYCEWLSLSLPASMANMEVRLPLETEWEYAALHGIINRDIPGWEWCADPYAPHLFINASYDAIKAIDSPEQALRGKSISSSDTRASLPKDLSSPFVTFRAVIAPKK